MENIRPKLIYLDTSVISAYFDERSPLRQHDTELFWQTSADFHFVVSRLVFSEINRTPSLSKRNKMFELIDGLPILASTQASDLLAADFARENLVPPKKFDDAQHLAMAVANGVDFLVSWNFKHMVNYRTIEKLPMLSAKNGYFKQVVVLSPSAFTGEIMEDEEDELT